MLADLQQLTRSYDDASSRTRAALVVRVEVNGEVRFASRPLRAGDPAVPARVSLPTGNSTLTIVAEATSPGDAGALLDIGTPTLYR